MRQISATHFLVIVAAFFFTACGANTSITGARSPGAMPKRCFWPPPRSTSLWLGEAARTASDRNIAQVGRDLAGALRARGYVQQRWFPIGLGFVHGFAVATRLEHVDAHGGATGLERWIAWQPEPANLFWLPGAKTVRLPEPGRYRVFLLAFTDLPLGPTPTAPIWARDTLMAGPEVPETLSEADLPAGRRLRSSRLGVYVYVYERGALGDDGGFVSAQASSRTEGPPAEWIETFASTLN